MLGVGCGPDRIVEVAGVGSVDGDEGDVPEIGPSVQRSGSGGAGFRQRPRVERGRDVVGVDSDVADRLDPVDRLQPFENPGAAQAQILRSAPSGVRLGAHQLVGPGAGALRFRDLELAPQAPVGRYQPSAVGAFPVDPEDAPGCSRDAANGACLVAFLAQVLETGQHGIAHAERGRSGPAAGAMTTSLSATERQPSTEMDWAPMRSPSRLSRASSWARTTAGACSTRRPWASVAAPPRATSRPSTAFRVRVTGPSRRPLRSTPGEAPRRGLPSLWRGW